MVSADFFGVVFVAEGREDVFEKLGNCVTVLLLILRSPSFRACLKKNVFIQPSEISVVSITLVLVVFAFMPRASTCFDLACVAFNFVFHHYFRARYCPV